MSSKNKSKDKAPDKEAVDIVVPEIEGDAAVAEVLQKLSRPQREIIIQAIEREAFSGPLPHPKLLKAYDEVQPGFAERIVKMAEK